MALNNSYELFDQQKAEVEEWYVHEISGIRTGRVTPDMVSHIPVELYGARTPLNSLASISNSDARTLVISPWDPGSVQAIDKALMQAGIGATPSNDGQVIRLVFPSLTEEVREQTVRQLHRKTEEARVRLRQARDEALKIIKEEKESGALTKDDFYDGREQLDQLIEQANNGLEELQKKKEKDVRAI